MYLGNSQSMKIGEKQRYMNRRRVFFGTTLKLINFLQYLCTCHALIRRSILSLKKIQYRKKKGKYIQREKPKEKKIESCINNFLHFLIIAMEGVDLVQRLHLHIIRREGSFLFLKFHNLLYRRPNRYFYILRSKE